MLTRQSGRDLCQLSRKFPPRSGAQPTVEGAGERVRVVPDAPSGRRPRSPANVASGIELGHPLGDARRISSSRAPTTSRTGIGSSGSRSHSGSWVPVPASRRLEARPSAVLRRRSSSPAASRGSVAKSGSASQRSRNPTDPVALDRRGKLLVGLSPGRPLGVVVDPRRRADEHKAANELGLVDGELEAEATAHRVADVRRRPTYGTEQRRGRRDIGADSHWTRRGPARRR